MWKTQHNNADWDCFKTPILREILEDSNSTSGGTLCVFGRHTFVPISWMCKKQSSVSHSSPESEIISLDAGLRLDGIPALVLWDLIVTLLHGNTSQSHKERRDPFMNQREVRSTPHTIQKRKQSLPIVHCLSLFGHALVLGVVTPRQALDQCFLGLLFSLLFSLLVLSP